MIEKIKKEIDKKLFAFKEVNSNELIKVISLEDISKILEKQLALTDVVSCGQNYTDSFRGLCKCCEGNGWIDKTP